MPAPRPRLVIALLALLASTALADDQASNFEVLEAVACREIQNREPVGVAEQFPEDTTTVWAYLKIRNLTTPRTVRMTWHRDGVEVYSGEVKVGRSPLWRTWSRKRMGKGDA
ncbi:MAG: hypothetical protein KC620_24030, partial [Myxococcales bacterium]|nr:hypothetical protein [Myxococcales bacterium]